MWASLIKMVWSGRVPKEYHHIAMLSGYLFHDFKLMKLVMTFFKYRRLNQGILEPGSYFSGCYFFWMCVVLALCSTQCTSAFTGAFSHVMST